MHNTRGFSALGAIGNLLRYGEGARLTYAGLIA